MLQQSSVVRVIVFATLFVVIFAAVSLLWNGKDRIRLQIGGQLVSAHVADSEAERARGLSGKGELSDNEAMLFVFEKSAKWGIWMKDMNYSIDIVWLDEYKRVIHIVESAPPESYPKVFEPRDSARYVIELPAGYVARHNVAKGALVAF